MDAHEMKLNQQTRQHTKNWQWKVRLG